ncbi:MAG: Uma2 family endonuclease, partial [Planctomycetes bacterium]|nr:Uma2 family endonuclease [Planctomycetota bacterium]
MSAALKWNLVAVDDYLKGELSSPVKHEYVGGVVYAMAGARNSHNKIKDNTLISLGSRLRGRRCQAHGSDTKVRIQLPTHYRFYYPDDHVTCEHNPPTDSFQDKPVVIFEVLSRSTRRIDEGEKKDAYLTIPSLKVYVLVEQDMPALIVFRRGATGF